MSAFSRLARPALALGALALAHTLGAPIAEAAPTTYNYSGGIVTWVVPQTGTYQIVATGAQGASAQAGYSGGRGARMTGEFDLVAGDTYYIAVGGAGVSVGGSGGGGGGTFFVRASDTAPLVVAGGGGGTRALVQQNGTDASTSNYGMTASGSEETYTPAVKMTDLGLGGVNSSSSWGSAGAGFFGDGGVDPACPPSPAHSWANGMGGGGGTAPGGFGGGGSGQGCNGGGGGGGYSGGDGGRVAGGGGSYNAGANPVAVAGVGTGNGTLTIELLNAPVLTMTAGDLAIEGDEGGANWTFTGPTTNYTLGNTGSGVLNWTSTLPAWLSAAPSSGTIAIAGSAPFAPAPNAAANALTPGVYIGTIAVNSDGGTEIRNVTITVRDATAPQFATGPSSVTIPTQPGLASATYTYATPTFTDNVGVVSVTQIAGLASGASFPVGTTTNTFRASDAAGNTTDATFTVTVVDTEAPVFTVTPSNIAVGTDPGQSSAVVTYGNLTATDNVGVLDIVQTAGLASGAAFPVGVTTNTFRARDVAGNFTDFSFTVTVSDPESPVFSGGPGNIVIGTDPGLATAVVTFTTPTFTDNVGIVSVTQIAGLPSGSAFPIGVTTNTFRAVDAASNATNYSFTVTVNDTEPPVLVSVPANITINVNYPATSATATWTAPTATDNAPGVTVSLVAGLPPGSTFPLGTTTITYRATDAAANTADGSFTVTVTQIPPGSVTLVVNTGEDGSFGFTSNAPGLSGAVSTSGGTGTRGPIAMAPGVYTLSFTVPAGFGVTSASCTSGGTLNPTTQSGSLNLTSGGAITCTVTTVDALGETASALGSHLETRAALIVQNAPDVARRLERLTGGAGGTGGISGFGFSMGQGVLPFSMTLGADEVRFSTSLLGISRSGGASMPTPAQPRGESIADPLGDSLFGMAGQRLMLAPLQAEAAPAAGNTGADVLGAATGQIAPMSRRFDIWLEGRYARFDTAGGEGNFGILHVGADYLVTERVLVGVGLQYDWLREDTIAGGEVDGQGYLVGPYLTARLSERVFIDLRAAWGSGDTDVSPFGTYVDTVDSDRSLISGAVIGDFVSGAWSIRPELRLTRYEERTEAYIDSLNVAIPSFKVVTGFLEFGPDIGYLVTLDNGGTLRPNLTVQGIWTFEQTNTAGAPSNSQSLAERGLRARTEFGVDYQSGGFALSIAAFYDGIGDDDYDAWGGRLRLNMGF